MKKNILLLVLGFVLFSCGSDKKKEAVVEKKIEDDYSISIDALYEKDDSLLFIYEKDGALLFDKVKGLKVKGSPMMQKVVFNFPKGEKVENIGITMSFNKDQKNLVVKGITIKDGDKTIIKSEDNYLTYFQAGDGFSWDAKNSKYILDHTKKYPPSFMGSEDLRVALHK